MSRELDVQVAEAMGWHWDDDWGCLIPPEQKAKPDEMWLDWQYDKETHESWRDPALGAAISGIVYNGNFTKIHLPEYGSDIAAARIMEDWINDHCDRLHYVEAMVSVLRKDGVLPTSQEWVWWAIAYATPEQRCRAFLTAMGK